MDTNRPFARPAIVIHALAALGGLVLLLMLVTGHLSHGLYAGLGLLLVLRVLAEMGHRYRVRQSQAVPAIPD